MDHQENCESQGTTVELLLRRCLDKGMYEINMLELADLMQREGKSVSDVVNTILGIRAEKWLASGYCPRANMIAALNVGYANSFKEVLAQALLDERAQVVARAEQLADDVHEIIVAGGALEQGRSNHC